MRASAQNLTIIALDEVLNLPPTIGAYVTEKAAAVAGALTTVGLVAPLEAAVGVSLSLFRVPFALFVFLLADSPPS